MLYENMASLVAFAMCLLAFAFGYTLRNWIDEARAEWAETFAYRQRQARKRAAYRRLNDGN